MKRDRLESVQTLQHVGSIVRNGWRKEVVYELLRWHGSEDGVLAICKKVGVPILCEVRQGPSCVEESVVES